MLAAGPFLGECEAGMLLTLVVDEEQRAPARRASIKRVQGRELLLRGVFENGRLKKHEGT